MTVHLQVHHKYPNIIWPQMNDNDERVLNKVIFGDIKLNNKTIQ